MRAAIMILPLLAAATPAFAQAKAPGTDTQIAAELTKPENADMLANMMQALSKGFLELPAGELQAIAEGRKATAAERKMTVRDMGRREDPELDRKVRDQLANAKPMIQQSMKALAGALPAMMGSMRQAGEALERAATSLPDPTYPKR